MRYLIMAAVLTPCALAAAQAQDLIDDAFGAQADGVTLTEVRATLAPHAGDDAVDFALGATDFLIATEGLLQQMHRLGFMETFRGPAMFAEGRLSFIEWISNPDPDPATAKDVHDAVLAWTEALATADETLAAVDGDFGCVIDLRTLRFDIDSSGVADDDETLNVLFMLLPMADRWNEDAGAWERVRLVEGPLVVRFDRGDAEWLRGYCHVMMAIGDWMLAHDGRELFDHTGHIYFPKAQIKYDYLPNSTWTIERLTGGAMDTPAPFDVTDVIAFFANMRLPVDEPERMRAALEHLRAAVAHAKAMWAFYDAEEDDDREWVPNPDQTAAFGDVVVDAEMRAAWLAFLDESDDVLHGRKVLRFWRGDGTRGIDVVEVFEEPREFDLVYWIQGSAAAPYLREGEFTTPETWRQLLDALDNRAFRYMFWFN